MDKKESLMMSVSGVRGIVGKNLSPNLLVRLAQAFGTLVGPGTIVVGRDTRTSGEMVKHAVFSGLMSSGCEVIDVEICPTPTVQIAVRELEAKGGIVITASHNPVEWNALKFVGPDGIFLDESQAQKLFSIYEKNNFREVIWSDLCPGRSYSLAVRTHIKKILEYLDKDLIYSKNFKVVLDACNAAGSVISPILLRELGCSVVELNTSPDGFFPRPPEPIPENLGVLCSVVKATGADIGFAHDSDADRLSIVSEKGVAVGEEKTLALAVDYVLGQKKGTVVTNLSTSMAIDDIVKKHKGRIVRTKVGEVNVTKAAKANNAVIAGEGNGGVIIPQIHYGRDGVAAIGLILQYMASVSKPVSVLVDAIPSYHIVKKKIKIKARVQVPSVLKKVASKYKGSKLDWTDGLKVLYGDSWIHFRASGTEPVIRIISEAVTEKKAQQMCNSGMDLIEKLTK